MALPACIGKGWQTQNKKAKIIKQLILDLSKV
jgi:hypothetical protein